MVRDKSISSLSLTAVVHVVLLIVLVITAFPILHVISMSVSSPYPIVAGLVSFYPQGFQLEGYRAIVGSGRIVRAMRNSVIYMLSGTLINLIMTVLLAYPLSKKYLPFRNLYTILVVITMYFSGGIVPLYILVRKLGMYDTMWALILPGAISAFNMIIMRTFFQGLPEELEESAYMDGANTAQVLIRIVLPLSKASLFTIGLFYAVGHWNAYMPAVMYIRSGNKQPLQYVLHQIVSAAQMSEELAAMRSGDFLEIEKFESSIGLERQAMSEMIKYSTLVFSLIPMLIVYPFVQRYFVQGVMIGSLKG